MTNSRSGMTGRYLADRERVLGGRITIDRDPAVAAEDLVDQFGSGAAARRWTAELLAAVTVRASRRC